MNQWDHDRVEIEQHWNRLGFFWRFVILFIFPLLTAKKAESIGFILNRLFTRPDRMVRLGEDVDTEGHVTVAYWDSIYNFLRKS